MSLWSTFSSMRLIGLTTASFMYSDTGGPGPVVLLLHGVLMNGTVWTQVVDALRGRYRCIVPELPFGAHARPMPDDANLALESIARMTAEFLAELQLQNVTLACNDCGFAFRRSLECGAMSREDAECPPNGMLTRLRTSRCRKSAISCDPNPRLQSRQVMDETRNEHQR